MAETLRLGTRGSPLALAQSGLVAQMITANTGVSVVLEVIRTRGDRVLDRPLAALGGKGLFTAELEAALAGGAIDLAVHSLKDLPTDDPPGLCIGAIPRREDPRDALIGPPLASLPPGARVGSGSTRRRAQLLEIRADLAVLDIRGNVGTRLRRLDEGDFDAIVLAVAGMNRLGLARPDLRPFGLDEMVPAPGQGALAVQIRAGDARVRALVATVDDPATRRAAQVERTFLAEAGGGCNSPGACHAWLEAGRLHAVAVGLGDDGRLRRVSAQEEDGVALGRRLAAALSGTA